MTSKAKILQADGYEMPAEPENGKKTFGLKELQVIVGGTIDIQKLPKTKQVMVVNDNGKVLGLRENKNASELWRKNYPIEEYPFNNDGRIVGNVLVCERRMIR